MNELSIKKGRALLNNVIVTSDKYTREELDSIYQGGIIPANLIGELKPYQRVLYVSVRIQEHCPIKEGDLVLININRYGRSVQHKDSIKSSMNEEYNAKIVYSLPMITINGVDYLKLGDNDIEFIIDEYEFNKKSSLLFTEEDRRLILN